jgi:hypothetical protein
MKKYLLHEIQSGGCDYTIACGVRITDLGEHESLQAAVNAVCGNDEYGEPILKPDYITTAVVYEVSDLRAIDLAGLALTRRFNATMARQAEQEAEDRATYEKLKRRFET